MRVCPNPPPAGATARGPAVSVQTILRMRWLFRIAVVQATLTVPDGTDSEPYFAALVASSCSTKPKGVARYPAAIHTRATDRLLAQTWSDRMREFERELKVVRDGMQRMAQIAAQKEKEQAAQTAAE